MRILLFVAALGTALGSAASADEVTSARDHFRRGTAAFNLGHYLDAVKEYEAAYQMKEDPALLFNIAQAYRLAGENEPAVRVYKSFLHQLPNAPQRHEVEQRVAELQETIDQQRRIKEAPPTADTPSAPPSPLAHETAAAAAPPLPRVTAATEVLRPRHKDVAAMTMGSIGVVALAAGLGLGVTGSLDLTHAAGAADLQDHDHLRTNGTIYSAAGYSLVGVGAVLCIAAAIKWSVGSKHRRLASTSSQGGAL